MLRRDLTEAFQNLLEPVSPVPVTRRDEVLPRKHFPVRYREVPMHCRDGIASFRQVILWLMPVPVLNRVIPERYREIPKRYRDELTELHREHGLW